MRLEEAFEKVLQYALDSGTAVEGALAALADDSAALSRTVAVGKHAALLAKLDLEAPESPFARVLTEGKCRYLIEPSDVASALRITAPEQQAPLKKRGAQAKSPPHALLILPLQVDIQCIGVLVLAINARSKLAPDDLQLWESVAALCTLAACQTPGRGTSSQQSSEERDRLRSEMMATLSHELRTPLSTVKGCATALLMEEIALPQDEQREFLRLIDEECDNMQIMISDLMDSALIDVGRLVLEPDLVRLPNLAREMVNEIHNRATRHVFVVGFPADFPLLRADPHWLKQVFRNILDNAVKYSPDGGMVVIRAEARENDVVVSIVDQGVGIAPEDLIPLFDKYFRVKSATGPHVAGTGLGLPVARAIVEAPGGHIWAESRVGQGTTISFSLPLAEVNTSSPNTAQRE
jgi:K+-sensing histidine kinase KdpD